MNHFFATLSLFVIFCTACGEAEEITIPTRPDRTSFDDAQETMLTIGCGVAGCHAVLVGDFKLTEFPKSPTSSESEYLLTKPFLDLEDAENSLLMRTALQDDPNALGHAICFDSVDSCAFRRLVAWINFTADGDQTMEEACPSAEIIDNACFL